MSEIPPQYLIFVLFVLAGPISRVAKRWWQEKQQQQVNAAKAALANKLSITQPTPRPLTQSKGASEAIARRAVRDATSGNARLAPGRGKAQPKSTPQAAPKAASQAGPKGKSQSASSKAVPPVAGTVATPPAGKAVVVPAGEAKISKKGRSVAAPQRPAQVGSYALKRLGIADDQGLRRAFALTVVLGPPRSDAPP